LWYIKTAVVHRENCGTEACIDRLCYPRYNFCLVYY